MYFLFPKQSFIMVFRVHEKHAIVFIVRFADKELRVFFVMRIYGIFPPLAQAVRAYASVIIEVENMQIVKIDGRNCRIKPRTSPKNRGSLLQPHIAVRPQRPLISHGIQHRALFAAQDLVFLRRYIHKGTFIKFNPAEPLGLHFQGGQLLRGLPILFIRILIYGLRVAALQFQPDQEPLIFFIRPMDFQHVQCLQVGDLGPSPSKQRKVVQAECVLRVLGQRLSPACARFLRLSQVQIAQSLVVE